MKREEYEEAIRVSQADLISHCTDANFIEVEHFVDTSAHYLIELAKRWDWDRDQARHMAHNRKGKRISIEKAVSEAASSTKRYMRDKTFKDMNEKYAAVEEPVTKDPPVEAPPEPRPKDPESPKSSNRRARRARARERKRQKKAEASAPPQPPS